MTTVVLVGLSLKGYEVLTPNMTRKVEFDISSIGLRAELSSHGWLVSVHVFIRITLIKIMDKHWRSAGNKLIGEKIPLTIYHSTRSKLRVFVAQTPGPIVDGRITLGTEIHTNDGLPHTIEHLTFMGSENFPAKGALDIIANRCLASGTNACTEQDNTCYMLSTAGASGFLKVLPVFLDHILKPTLKNAHYMTEVHHIDATGKDSGVVYCEMQALESQMGTMVGRKRQELFYPSGSSYAAVVGGALLDIRQLCSLERVRNFHQKFYRLSNLYITVCGEINEKELLDIIEPIESSCLRATPEHFPPPFQHALPDIDSRTTKIVCPSDDESFGMVEMAWIGPAGFDVQTSRALLVLFDYLTDTAAAPLRKDFVQIEDPFCTSVSVSLLVRRECEIVAAFKGVPVGKLDDIRARFFTKTVADHQLPGAFDMGRIGFILDLQARKFYSKLENCSTSLISRAIVGHQLYGQSVDQDYAKLGQCLNEADLLSGLKEKKDAFWRDLFTKYLANQNCVCVLAEPNAQEAVKRKEEEKARIAQQISRLGGEGLKERERLLDEAIAENARVRITEEQLRDLIVHEFEPNLVVVSTYSNLTAPSTPSSSSEDFVNKFKFDTYLHKVPSAFIDAEIIFEIGGMRAKDRHYLMLWFELMFQSPAVVDGAEISYEEVARDATRDLVSQSVSVGLSSVYDRCVMLRLRTSADTFDNLAKWAKIYLKGVRFRSDRVAICAKNLANKAADDKRDGSRMCQFINATSTYSSDATAHFFSYLGLEKFHKAVATAIEDKGAAVLARLEAVRKRVLDAPFTVHFSGTPLPSTIEDDIAAPWNFLDSTTKRECPPNYAETMRCGKSRAIVVGGVDSAFLLQKSCFKDGWNGQSTIPTLLLANYMTVNQGPLWRAVRDTGLAYGASLYLMPNREALSLDIDRCSQLEAYEKTRESVFAVLDVQSFETLDPIMLESAKGKIICELVTGKSTINLAATAAMHATMRSGVTQTTFDECKKVWNAKGADVLELGTPAIRLLFDMSQSVRSIALGPSRQEELKQHFPRIEIVKIDDFQVKPHNF